MSSSRRNFIRQLPWLGGGLFAPQIYAVSALARPFVDPKAAKTAPFPTAIMWAVKYRDSDFADLSMILGHQQGTERYSDHPVFDFLSPDQRATVADVESQSYSFTATAFDFLNLLDQTYDLGSPRNGLNIRFYGAFSDSTNEVIDATRVEALHVGLGTLQLVLDELGTGVQIFEASYVLFGRDILQGRLVKEIGG